MGGSYWPDVRRATVLGVDEMAKAFSGPGQCLLIYDGRCRMCVTAKRGLERLTSEGDGLRMIPYQSEEARKVLGARYHGDRPEAAFLVTGERVATGLDAFLPLLPGLKGGRLLAKMFALPFVKPFAYWIYGLVARYRYKLFGQVPLDLPR
jgi:predicted DCC family thiol-disulfide oxidoreductase YuxK